MMNPSDFLLLENSSRRSLRMYDLTERERRICDVIIEWSFGRGKEDAVIPELDVFVDLTGIDRGDVSKALKLLLARRIVQRRGPRDARTYAFLPFAAYWQETKPLYDSERAVMRAAELDRVNGQKRLPVEDADLDDGMAMASRDCALDEAARDGPDEIGNSPTTGAVGNSPTTGGVGKSPIPPRDAHARAGDVLQNVRVQNVKLNVSVGESPTGERETSQRKLSFADPEKNYVFEELERIAAGADFERYRYKWLQRVRDFPGVVREAIGDVKVWQANPHNKLRKPAGALIFQRAKAIAVSLGKDFRLW